jgi:serine/threonine-protein kinase
MSVYQSDYQSRRHRIPPGTRLNGVYEVETLIATGGMGEIYKGHTVQTGDPVAIKTIRPDLAENEAAIALFTKEAAALHNLYHEAIVRYYVFTTDPVLGCTYLAMEYVDGQPLSEILKSGPLGVDAVRILQRRLASGLQAAHELGIVHRDVSPDNVILPGGNVARAKIIDFGIARTTLAGDQTVIGGGFAGKLGYVSPEQLGLFGGEVTAKSDVYSLGLVLAEALSGRSLEMGGTQLEVIDKRRKVPDVSKVDRRMRPLLERMLQPKPADRPASMAEVAAWQPASAELRGRRISLPLLGGLGAAAAVALALWFGPALLEQPRRQDASTSAPLREDRPEDAVPQQQSQLPPQRTEQGFFSPEPGEPQSREQPTPGAGSHDRAQVPAERPAPPPRDPSASPVEQITRYIEAYPGGNCFLLLPRTVTSRSAGIEAFGTSPPPFEEFDRVFKETQGFEAEIALRLVTPAQCPVLTFVRQLELRRASALRLELANFVVREGQPLSGSVSDVGDRHVALLLIADEGLVYNLSEFSKRSGSSMSFNLKLDRQNGGPAKPQILLAITSQKPLSSASFAQPVAAETLFPQVASEARMSGQPLGTALKYFRLE